MIPEVNINNTPAVEPKVLEREATTNGTRQKTENVAKGIFGKIAQWCEKNVLPILKKPWTWIVFAAGIIGTAATVALSVFFGGNVIKTAKIKKETKSNQPLLGAKDSEQPKIEHKPEMDKPKGKKEKHVTFSPSIDNPRTVTNEAADVKVSDKEEGLHRELGTKIPSEVSQSLFLVPLKKQKLMSEEELSKEKEESQPQTAMAPEELPKVSVEPEKEAHDKLEKSPSQEKVNQFVAMFEQTQVTHEDEKKPPVLPALDNEEKKKNWKPLPQIPAKRAEEKKEPKALPGKLNPALLSLKINPGALLPGAKPQPKPVELPNEEGEIALLETSASVKPTSETSKTSAASTEETSEEKSNHYNTMLRGKPKGPTKRLPSKKSRNKAVEE